jgi:hypothetical protein
MQDTLPRVSLEQRRNRLSMEHRRPWRCRVGSVLGSTRRSAASPPKNVPKCNLGTRQVRCAPRPINSAAKRSSQ